MKKILRGIFCAALAATFCLSLAACTAGPKGDTGLPGASGEDGEDGLNGSSGLSAYQIYQKYHPAYQGTEEEWINALANGSLAASYTTSYNIVFTIASIPPVLAALDSIGNGNETYAIIERGATYSGIATSESLNFHNVGFTAGTNTAGLSAEQFSLMTDQIKELNVFGNEQFVIYVRDADYCYALGLASNAGLLANQYKIVLCEDGSASYNYFKSTYVTEKTTSADADEPYEAFLAKVEEVERYTREITSSSENVFANLPVDFTLACAAAAMDNVTWRLQSGTQLTEFLESTSLDGSQTKLLSAIGAEGYDEETEYSVDIRYGGISDSVESFSDTQREAYLSLMYGNHYQGTYDALTRTALSDGTEVPSEKLVFIGGRISSYPKLASDGTYGIGGAASASDVPDSYAELDAKYKTPLLFATEEDYRLFLDALGKAENYDTQPTAAQLQAIRVTCFNYYIDYIFTLKLTYALYGGDYDIIIKGHPSEVLGNFANWGVHYETAATEGVAAYRFDRLISNLVEDFHAKDSVGKYIGMVPYGTAAENLAYLGASISIGGLDSSTYKGYDTDVPVLFLLTTNSGDITTNTNLNERYEAGTLVFRNLQGEDETTFFCNLGNLYKTISSYYTAQGDAQSAAVYLSLYENWLRAQNGLSEGDSVEGYGVDDQGFITVPAQD